MKKEEKFEIYKNWVKENKRIPSQCSKNEEEKSLGKWRNHNRTYSPLLKFEKEMGFITRIFLFGEERFKKEYIPWVKEHKRIPFRRSKDEEEKSLGIWRNNNRTYPPLLKFEEEMGLTTRVRLSREERFRGEYISWVKEHKRKPSYHSKDEEEKNLWIWRNNNRTYLPLLKFEEEMRFTFRSCLSREKRFKEEYIPWIKENKRFPSQRSKDKEERSLGDWRYYNKTWNDLKLFDSLFYSSLTNEDAGYLLEVYINNWDKK